MNLITLVLDALAAHRLTRLATADVITERPRNAIIRQAYVQRDGEDVAYELEAEAPYSTWTERATDDDHPPMLAKLLTCRWCAGWWISMLIVLARRRRPTWWQPVAEVAACSSAAALLAALED